MTDYGGTEATDIRKTVFDLVGCGFAGLVEELEPEILHSAPIRGRSAREIMYMTAH